MRSVIHRVFFTEGVSKEVPAVAGDVQEDRHSAVGLGSRLAKEDYVGICHPSVRAVEVIDAKEEPDSTGCLIADGSDLAITVCPGEKKTGLSTRRTYDHPALGSSVVGERRGVLDKVEPEYAGEERDGRVVLVNDQSHQVDLHVGQRTRAVASDAAAP